MDRLCFFLFFFFCLMTRQHKKKKCKRLIFFVLFWNNDYISYWMTGRPTEIVAPGATSNSSRSCQRGHYMPRLSSLLQRKLCFFHCMLTKWFSSWLILILLLLKTNWNDDFWNFIYICQFLCFFLFRIFCRRDWIHASVRPFPCRRVESAVDSTQQFGFLRRKHQS